MGTTSILLHLKELYGKYSRIARYESSSKSECQGILLLIQEFQINQFDWIIEEIELYNGYKVKSGLNSSTLLVTLS